MAWEVRKTSSPSKSLPRDRPHPPRSATGGGTSKNVVRCLEMSSGNLTWADRVRGGSRATGRKKVVSEEVKGVERTESQRTERRMDGGGEGEVDGGGVKEVEDGGEGEVDGGGVREVEDGGARKVDGWVREVDGGKREVDDGGVKEVEYGRDMDGGEGEDGSVKEVDGEEGEGEMNGGAEGRPENGRGVKEVVGGEKEGGEVVECDAYSATERGAGELVVVEDVHSRDAAEVRLDCVTPSPPPPLVFTAELETAAQGVRW